MLEEFAPYLKGDLKNNMTNKTFNIVISGTGGQGLITLLQILTEAALIECYDVKTSETHGLSQRGGSVETHIRFGEKVFSPLISLGSADLILGLDIIEGLRAAAYANSKTIFLMNKKAETVKEIKVLKNPVYLIPASEICQKELGKEVVSGIYLLSYAIHKKLIPLKPTSISKAISKIIPEKYLGLNKKAFELVLNRQK